MKYYVITSVIFLMLSPVACMPADYDIDEEYIDYSFPKEEYEHYMKLIEDIDPAAYQRLRDCEHDLGKPCIDEAVDIHSMVDPGSEETKGYPILVIKSLRDLSDYEEGQKSMLRLYIDWYNEVEDLTLMTQEERNIVLDLIKTVAPELHAEIIKIDPTGEKHVQTSGEGTFSSGIHKEDYYPIIWVDRGSLKKYPRKLLEATIAHELGHYVSGHSPKLSKPTHTFLFPRRESFANKGLPAKETFNLAQQRIREYEADRSEIMDFNIDIDTAIEQAKILQAEAEELQFKEPSKETFKTTHPLWADRIQHFESLRPEAALKKIRGQGKTQFDWEKIAQEYMHDFNKPKI